MSRSVLVDGEGDDAFAPPDPSSSDAIRSTVEVRSRRRTIGQGLVLLVVGAGVWLVVTGGDSSVIGRELGSDDGLSPERVALARILDGVVAHVEVEAIDTSGDQGAEFGAGAGPSGRPPAAPSLIGRDDPMPGRPDLGSGPVAPSGPSVDDGELVPAASDSDNTIDGDNTIEGGDTTDGDETGAADPVSGPSTTRSSTNGRPATTRRPASTATTRSPTVTAAGVTTSTTTPSTPSTTAPATVTTGAVTTGAVTTGAVTTVSTTATTAASTTQPESNCVVTVSRVTQYRADHKGSSPVIGQATPGTYNVLERHGAKWYRVAGGWLRDNKKVTPSGC